MLAAVDAVLAKESSPTKWGDIPLAEFGVMPNKYAEFFDAVAYEYALQRITRKN